jgi:hypothetical protein
MCSLILYESSFDLMNYLKVHKNFNIQVFNQVGAEFLNTVKILIAWLGVLIKETTTIIITFQGPFPAEESNENTFNK